MSNQNQQPPQSFMYVPIRPKAQSSILNYFRPVPQQQFMPLQPQHYAIANSTSLNPMVDPMHMAKYQQSLQMMKQNINTHYTENTNPNVNRPLDKTNNAPCAANAQQLKQLTIIDLAGDSDLSDCEDFESTPVSENTVSVELQVQKKIQKIPMKSLLQVQEEQQNLKQVAVVPEKKPLPQLKNFQPLKPGYSSEVGFEIGCNDLFDCLAVHQFIRDFAEDVFDVDRIELLTFSVFVRCMVPHEKLNADDVLLLNILKGLMYHLLSERLPSVHVSTAGSMFGLFLLDDYSEIAMDFFHKDFHQISFKSKIIAMNALINELVDLDEFHDHLRSTSIKITDIKAEISLIKKNEVTLRGNEPGFRFQIQNLEHKLQYHENEQEQFLKNMEREMDEMLSMMYPPTADESDERRESRRKKNHEIEQQRSELRSNFKDEIEQRERNISQLKKSLSEAQTELKQTVKSLEEIKQRAAECDIEMKRLYGKLRFNGVRVLGVDPYGRKFFLFDDIGCIVAEPDGIEESLNVNWNCIKTNNELTEFVNYLERYYKNDRLIRLFVMTLTKDDVKSAFAYHDKFTADVCVVADLSESGTSDIIDEMRELFEHCNSLIANLVKYKKLKNVNEAVFLQSSNIKYSSDDMLCLIETCTEKIDFINVYHQWMELFDNYVFETEPSCLACKLIFNEIRLEDSEDSERKRWNLSEDFSFSFITLTIMHFSKHLQSLTTRLIGKYGKLKQEAKSVKKNPEPVQKKKILRKKKRISYADNDSTESDDNEPKKPKRSSETMRKSKRLSSKTNEEEGTSSDNEASQDAAFSKRQSKSIVLSSEE